MKIDRHDEMFGAHCAPATASMRADAIELSAVVEQPMGRRGFLGLLSTGSAILLAGCGGGSGSSVATGSAAPVTIPDAQPAAAPPPPPPPPIASDAGVSTEVKQSGDPATGPARRLISRPPALDSNAIVIDLEKLNPTLPMPGWDGKGPSQKTSAMFPQDRDLLILGRTSEIWSGGGFIRGGKSVHWIGGTYTKGPWLRNFMGDACMEGILTRAQFSVTGLESGDSFSINPDAKTLATSKVFILNCRSENIDGFFDGLHGDCFQLAGQCDAPAGYSSIPREVTIERFTGSTGYQGFFLPAQHFDQLTNGYSYMIQNMTLLDVNLKKSRAQTVLSTGVVRGTPTLLFMIDMGSAHRGDKPYPKRFTNVFVEPAGSEGIDGCIFPNSKSANINPLLSKPLKAIVSPDGRSATYPPDMMLDGSIQLGPPAMGDFARAADESGRGGLDIPGCGYISPGYGA